MNTKRVRVQWTSADEGGRQTGFTGCRYSTVARFAGDPVPWKADELWSVVIDFDDPPVGSEPTTGRVRFLAGNAPLEKLAAGLTFELYEGSRVTATATVMDED